MLYLLTEECLAPKFTTSYSVINLMSVLYIKWADSSNILYFEIIGAISVIVEKSCRERAFVAQRLETGFLTVRSRVRLRWCAPLKISKKNETAVQCSNQFSAFSILIENSNFITPISFTFSEFKIISTQWSNAHQKSSDAMNLFTMVLIV